MHIEVKEFDPGLGLEYLAANYPGPGVYLNRRLNSTIVIYRTPGSTILTAMIVYLADLIKDGAPPTPVPTGISEDFVLKALAICQNPALAPQLIVKP